MKILSKSTEIAKALNFGKYPVLTINTDTKEGSKCVAIHKSSMYGEMRYNCTLNMGFDNANDGKLYIATEATMCKGEYFWTDYLECAEYANAPIIRENQEIAVYMYSPKRKIGFVRIVKTDNRIDTMCIVATRLTDIED